MSVLQTLLSNQAFHLVSYWMLLSAIEVLIRKRGRKLGLRHSSEFFRSEIQVVFGVVVPVFWCAQTIDDQWFLLQLLGFGLLVIFHVYQLYRIGHKS
jgi:hypothetical protein